MNCHTSSNLFGCVGLRNKQYCILNKQYSKEEYEALVPKIKAHMTDMPYVDSAGRIYKYGEFFPFEFSLLAFNQSSAQEYFPKTKEEVLAMNLPWHDADPHEYESTLTSDQLPDSIEEVGDEILKERIQCQDCKKAYLIIAKELAFYQRFKIPLPRKCYQCRYADRLANRNPRKI